MIWRGPGVVQGCAKIRQNQSKSMVLTRLKIRIGEGVKRYGIVINGYFCMLGQLKWWFRPEQMIWQGPGVVQGCAKIRQNHSKSLKLLLTIEICHYIWNFFHATTPKVTIQAKSECMVGSRCHPWRCKNEEMNVPTILGKGWVLNLWDSSKNNSFIQMGVYGMREKLLNLEKIPSSLW